MNLAAIILAAGYSSRIDGFKPLMQLGGQSLLAHCSALFRQAGIQNITVITGYRRREVEDEALKCGISSIYNNNFDQGMFTSVRTAVSHLTSVDGFFLLPVDIPLVRPATITTLIDAFQGKTVLHPTFKGLPGHPPLIPAKLIPTILAHNGAGGLKPLLAKAAKREVPVWDQGILLDADIPEDFTDLERRMSRMTIGDPQEALALATLTMPEKGVAHGLAVAETAKVLAQELNLHGNSLDLHLVNNAALLHDIAKGQPQHEALGAELLQRLGLLRTAEIVAVHRDVPPPMTEKLTEAEVVCLADKLVRGTTPLSVLQRFAEKLELYADDQEACRAIRGRLANALALQTLVERAVGKGINAILRSRPK
jgi:molybdenum cofactor cytidylyltransferase